MNIKTALDLNGVHAIHWDEARADKKKIISTRSMGERITDLESLQQALSKHARIAVQKREPRLQYENAYLLRG